MISKLILSCFILVDKNIFFIQVVGTVVGFYFLFLIKFATAGRIYNIVDYQAVGDGTIDDSQVPSWTKHTKTHRHTTAYKMF